MINLLPLELKQSYSYARRNILLRRWVVICLVALIGLGIITTYGLLRVHQLTNQYAHQVASTQSLFQKENFAGTQQQVQDISSSFKLVIKVLGQEVLFSQLLKQIAATIPANANLTGLNINQTQGGIDISAIATDYSTASQVQVNLADPTNKIFSKADIVNITCNSASTLNPKYPCTVNIRALFAANNPFLFINSKVKP
jgi:Tfp pilus assembly protein PilN